MRAKLAPMFHGFQIRTVIRDGVRLHTRIAGNGSPLLLLHGHPQTQTMWHRVAPTLAERFTVVLMDLRGYGDSSRPEPDAAHHAHSKREMALDALASGQAFPCGHYIAEDVALSGDRRGTQFFYPLIQRSIT